MAAFSSLRTELWSLGAGRHSGAAIAGAHGTGRGGGDFTPEKVPQGRHGWQWLCEAVDAGMLRWKKPDGPLLALAPKDLSARFAWQALEDGRRVLALIGLAEG
jgi:hypothetical protein